jgi:hypothetical protein
MLQNQGGEHYSKIVLYIPQIAKNAMMGIQARQRVLLAGVLYL